MLAEKLRRACTTSSGWIRLLLSAALVSNAVSAVGKPPLVAIDIGHTLRAPGATSARGIPEFEFNNSLAQTINRRLLASDLRTLLINGDGHIEGLSERTAIAGRAGADFFLSIHHDSVQPQYLSPWTVDGIERRRSEGKHGFSLFVSSLNADPACSLRCASAIGQALRREGFTPSRYHAEPINGENRPFADEENGVHFYPRLAVLRTARSPAVLLEAGVITDPEEERRLEDPATREAIGRAVAAGLQSCLTVAPPSTLLTVKLGSHR